MPLFEQLNETQLDALQETGNIGCSHAATAISKMINKQITITVPSIKVKPVGELQQALAESPGAGEKVVGVYIELTQEFQGSIIYVVPYRSALIMADLLMSQAPGTLKELDEMGQSAIQEVGNIIVSVYTNALGRFLNTTIMLSPPTFTHDLPGTMFENVMKTLGDKTTHALIFDTQFKEESKMFISYFLLLPSPASLDVLLQKLVGCLQPTSVDSEIDQYLNSLKTNVRK